jgi:hypothetical protein
VITYIVAIILGIIFLYWYGKMNQKKKEDIAVKGIETMGTVINRTIVRKPNQFETFMIKFDFEYNGKRVQSSTLFTEKWYYENAIIGMKYKVKYLTGAPKKNSEIYINKPIESEYANIEKERRRILNTYKDAKVSLKKNARALDKLQHLLK